MLYAAPMMTGLGEMPGSADPLFRLNMDMCVGDVKASERRLEAKFDLIYLEGHEFLHVSCFRTPEIVRKISEWGL